VTVIGWDGSPLGARALAALDQATLVVGGARQLAAVPVPAAARTIRLGALDSAIEALRTHGGRAVVLASGDPGFFGVVRRLRAQGLAVGQVLPAVSSVSAAFAAARLDWDDAAVVSAHGSAERVRSLRRAVNACLAHPKVAVLTGPGAGAGRLASGLLEAGLGAGDRIVHIAENLGSDRERVRSLDLVQAAAAEAADPHVVLCVAPGDERVGAGWLAGPAAGAAAPKPLPDEAFAHRDGQITKQETRALIVSRLAPGFGDLVWDLGAGSGSVGIECARRGAAVFAVERDPDSCARIRRNATAHGRTGLYICEGDAADLAGTLPAPDAVFLGGGGIEVLRAVLDRRPPRLVAAYAALERAAEVLPLLASHGYAAEGMLHQASRLSRLPDGSHRLAALNPVFLVWGELL
jgi:precorrin-6Y C5,15-methyltransferase (decarboxylating)